MVNEPDPASSPRMRRRLPRVSDLREVTDEMIAFADTYQQVFEQEAKATLALGEFLHAHSEALRLQVQLMRMGSDVYQRYNDWSAALFGLRPETFMDGIVAQIERLGFGATAAPGRGTAPE